jgi:hypothetical protein
LEGTEVGSFDGLNVGENIGNLEGEKVGKMDGLNEG